MKPFTIGLIAGTAFAEPNLRPTDRKLSGETIGTDHTLTLDGTAYVNLNTIAGVKVLAEAFKTQEQGKLALCETKAGEYTTAFTTWNQDNGDYNSCVTTYNGAVSTYNTCRANADSAYQTAWDTWNACETQNTETSNIITAAETAAGSPPPGRRLDIEPGHIIYALQTTHSNLPDCEEEPDEASYYSSCNDPGDDDCTGAGDEPVVNYSSCNDPGVDDCTGAGLAVNKGDYTWGNDALSIDLCDADIAVGTCNIFNPNLQCRISGIQAVIAELIVT